MPRTLRNVSCWPAKDASGRSSAVALERTAKEALRVVPGQLLVRRPDVGLEIGRERLLDDRGRGSLSRPGELLDVVGVQARRARR